MACKHPLNAGLVLFRWPREPPRSAEIGLARKSIRPVSQQHRLYDSVPCKSGILFIDAHVLKRSSHSLTHTHFLNLSLSHSHAHTLSESLSLSLSHTHMRTHARTHTHTHTHARTHTHAHTHTHTHTYTHQLGCPSPADPHISPFQLDPPTALLLPHQSTLFRHCLLLFHGRALPAPHLARYRAAKWTRCRILRPFTGGRCSTAGEQKG